MKITPDKFLMIVTKHLYSLSSRNNDDPPPVMYEAVKPMLYELVPVMMRTGVMDQDHVIDVDKLEKSLREWFSYMPILNIPFGSGKVTINTGMVNKFLEDVKKESFIEETLAIEN